MFGLPAQWNIGAQGSSPCSEVLDSAHLQALRTEWDYKLQRVYICQSVKQIVLTLWFAPRVFIFSDPPALQWGCQSMGTVEMYLKFHSRFPAGTGETRAERLFSVSRIPVL